MSEQLRYIVDLLEAPDPLPPSTRTWLRRALEQVLAGHDPREALGIGPRQGQRDRDEVLRRHAVELEGPAWRKSQVIATEAKKLHRGRRTALPWLARADRLKAVPETTRGVYNLLK